MERLVKLGNHLTYPDLVLMFALLVLAGLSFFLVPSWVVPGGTEVAIQVGDKVWGRFPLDRDRLIEVTGPLGKTVVEINASQARIISSPCANKICKGMGAVSKEGGFVACIPNEVVLSLGKDRPDGLDAVSR